MENDSNNNFRKSMTIEEASTSNQRKRRESLTYSEEVRSNRESIVFVNPNTIEHEGSLHP